MSNNKIEQEAHAYLLEKDPFYDWEFDESALGKEYCDKAIEKAFAAGYRASQHEGQPMTNEQQQGEMRKIYREEFEKYYAVRQPFEHAAVGAENIAVNCMTRYASQHSEGEGEIQEDFDLIRSIIVEQLGELKDNRYGKTVGLELFTKVSMCMIRYHAYCAQARADEERICENCGGEGKVECMPPGNIEDCPECHGTGKLPAVPKEAQQSEAIKALQTISQMAKSNGSNMIEVARRALAFLSQQPQHSGWIDVKQGDRFHEDGRYIFQYRNGEMSSITWRDKDESISVSVIRYFKINIPPLQQYQRLNQKKNS